jgi:hypothetical protein
MKLGGKTECDINRTGMGIRAQQKSGARASDPKVDLHFWGSSDAHFLDERIVRGGKPGPLFRTMRSAPP